MPYWGELKQGRCRPNVWFAGMAYLRDAVAYIPGRNQEDGIPTGTVPRQARLLRAKPASAGYLSLHHT